MRIWNPKHAIFALIAAIATTVFLVHYFGVRTLSTRPSTYIAPSGNKTLGFGAVYVLTEDAETWRVQGLRSAAKLIDLQLTVPVQRHSTDEEVHAYLSGDEPDTVLNEIRAVLNYMKLLETFINSGLETALFLEDDVDFGVDIKSQMQVASHALQYRSSSDAEGELGKKSSLATTTYPYGIDKWDVFWIGYYGVEFTNNPSFIYYDDPFALPWERLTSNFNNYYESLQPDPEHPERRHKQHLMQNSAPMGTYAFALTRNAAEEFLKELHNDRAQRFDYALHRKCKGQGFRCIAPVPVLMHHHRVVGGTSIHRPKEEGDAKDDLEWWRNSHKYTYNIEFSARCNAERVGESVQGKWQCMPGKYDMDE